MRAQNHVLRRGTIANMVNEARGEDMGLPTYEDARVASGSNNSHTLDRSGGSSMVAIEVGAEGVVDEKQALWARMQAGPGPTSASASAMGPEDKLLHQGETIRASQVSTNDSVQLYKVIPPRQHILRPPSYNFSVKSRDSVQSSSSIVDEHAAVAMAHRVRIPGSDVPTSPAVDPTSTLSPDTPATASSVRYGACLSGYARSCPTSILVLPTGFTLVGSVDGLSAIRPGDSLARPIWTGVSVWQMTTVSLRVPEAGRTIPSGTILLWCGGVGASKTGGPTKGGEVRLYDLASLSSLVQWTMGQDASYPGLELDPGRLKGDRRSLRGVLGSTLGRTNSMAGFTRVTSHVEPTGIDLAKRWSEDYTALPGDPSSSSKILSVAAMSDGDQVVIAMLMSTSLVVHRAGSGERGELSLGSAKVFCLPSAPVTVSLLKVNETSANPLLRRPSQHAAFVSFPRGRACIINMGDASVTEVGGEQVSGVWSPAQSLKYRQQNLSVVTKGATSFIVRSPVDSGAILSSATQVHWPSPPSSISSTISDDHVNLFGVCDGIVRRVIVDIAQIGNQALVSADQIQRQGYPKATLLSTGGESGAHVYLVYNKAERIWGIEELR